MKDKNKTIIKIANLAEFEHQTQQFLDQLIPYFLGKNKSNVLAQLFSEIEDNIKQHSQAYQAVLSFLKRSGELTDVIISDDGIGIGRSFRNAGINVDDQTALRLALKGRSTKKESSRGWGIRTTKALTLELKGNIAIDSGDARWMIIEGKLLEEPIPQHKGTTVTLTLPRNLEISDGKFYSIVAGDR